MDMSAEATQSAISLATAKRPTSTPRAGWWPLCSRTWPGRCSPRTWSRRV